ncbi:YbjQ family protein [Rhodohalobacter sp. 614A]|uniref:YbjQ family protein n=1 Tax=Rhodohalobacter sp. 614A TaxID=2908649 RepID=UPI001F190E55|nr:YbjQ family protein [Rhodohalobacter sp. 614A]
MLITTNDYFHNKEIEEYLGQVNEQIVIGANLFKDVFASFRDVFGGETKGYKNELDKLKSAAIRGLENEAKKLHANGVIGFHMDIDEISGGGKSMFMLNVYGTAVKFKINEEDKDGRQIGSQLSSEIVEYEIKKKSIQERLKKDERPFVDINSDELIKYKIFGLFDDGIDLNSLAYVDDKKLIKYLEIIPQSELEMLVFREIHSISIKYWICIVTALENRNWFNSSLILKLLEDQDPIRRFRALHLCAINKSFYDRKDVVRYSKISDFLNNKFNTQIKKTVEEGTFRNTEAWICPRCLRTNSMKGNSCECGAKNRYGLKNHSLDELKDILSKKAEVLREQFT